MIKIRTKSKTFKGLGGANYKIVAFTPELAIKKAIEETNKTVIQDLKIVSTICKHIDYVDFVVS
jgi:hypothetical protein